MKENISKSKFLSRLTHWNLSDRRPWIFKKFSDEFILQKLLFYHECEDDFFTSSWQYFNDKCFHAYRFLVAIVIFSYFVFDYTWEWFFYYKKIPLYYGIYATNWGFVSCVISFVYLAILHVFRIQNWDISPHASRISWFMYITSANCVMVTCVVYWLALSDATEGIFSTLESRVKHGLPLTLVILDLMLSSVPIRLVHVIYPASSGLMYTVFNVCYYLLGGLTPSGRSNAIYPMIDWDDPIFAFIGSMYVFLVCFVIQLIIFLLYLLRLVLTTSNIDKSIISKSRASTLDEVTFGRDAIPMINSSNILANNHSNGKVNDLNYFQDALYHNGETPSEIIVIPKYDHLNGVNNHSESNNVS